MVTLKDALKNIKGRLSSVVKSKVNKKVEKSSIEGDNIYGKGVTRLDKPNKATTKTSSTAPIIKKPKTTNNPHVNNGVLVAQRQTKADSLMAHYQKC